MEILHWKNAEGIQLYVSNWGVEKPRAVIALVHGQGEHIGRYAHVAKWFNGQGIAVMGLDLQGYGKSDGKRGHVRHLDAFLDDIGQLLEETRRHYPGIPLFLYGHSMGGNLALNYTLRRKPDIKGLIATSPWIRLAFEVPVLKVLAGRLLRRFTPMLTLPTGLAAHFISRDPEVVKAYKNDPLVHSQVSAAAGIALMEAAAWLNAFTGPTPVPTLLMHGGGDKITSAPATKEFSARLIGNIVYHEWPGLYHEMHNEKEQGEVFAFILGWMEKVLVF